MLRAPSRPPESEPAAWPRLWRWLKVRRVPRAVWIALAAVAAVTVLSLLAFGPIVRSRVAKEAARRKLDVEVGSVRPGFFAVKLHNVHVRPHGVSGLDLILEDVRIELGATLGLQSVTTHNGGLVIDGEPEEIAAKLRELRQPSGEAPKVEHASTPIVVDDLVARWRMTEGELQCAGLRLARENGVAHVSCGLFVARRGHLALEVNGGEIDFNVENAPHHVKARSAAVTYDPPALPAPPPTASATTIELPPLPQPTKKGQHPPPKTPVPVSDEPMLPLPDLHALQARLATTIAAVAPRIPDGAGIDIQGLSAKVDIGGEPMTFGPGVLTFARRAERLHLEFASANPAAGGTPLSLDADVPVGAGDITARLAGGPVSLQVLGVTEGAKGLMDVAHGMISGKGQLVLSADADALTFDGEVALRAISLKQPRLAPEPLRGIDLSVEARGMLDDHGKLRVDDAELELGALRMKTHGTIEETADHFAVALGVDVPPASCQALLDSTPQGLLPLVRAARVAGTFAANGSLAFDTRTIDKLTLDYRIDDQCRMTEVPRDMATDRFSGAFTYRTYHPDGTTGDTTTGPGTASWTALDDISPFMISAVLTTEDGAFYKHHGFNHSAIRSSVQANLKARRFVRGASTISMQLAKNLFLARDKALSRKVEEVVLTDYLEQVFQKDDLMELYLNIIEFGPDVYGITQAADYYFGRKPEELDVTECFFLASLLPSPIRYGKLRDKGEASETWLNHLHALMTIAARNHKITGAELEEGLKQPLVFVRPGEPRPEPRKPVTSTRRDPNDDDSAWRPLD